MLLITCYQFDTIGGIQQSSQTLEGKISQLTIETQNLPAESEGSAEDTILMNQRHDIGGQC
jgi:hypothetical protein